MVWLNGFAKDPKGKVTDPWLIIDGSEQLLAYFNHTMFWRILDGASIRYVDDDHDGFAENVQPEVTFARYADRTCVDAPTAPEEVDALHSIIGEALLAANDSSGLQRAKLLRRLRARLDKTDAPNSEDRPKKRRRRSSASDVSIEAPEHSRRRLRVT